MTVPGKGGRPRKWRSDADRVRAHRARQRGEDEPATFDAALVEGDELARSIEHAQQLQRDLAAAVTSIAASEAALGAERRRHEATQRKLERTMADLDGHRATDARRADELREAHAELDVLRAEISGLRAELAQLVRRAGPNRAERRRAAKRGRRAER